MSGRCRHSTTRRMWRIGESWCGWVAAARAGLEWEGFGACICNRCHEWLPLGHSDETDPRVAQEIRAAEIAAGLAAGGCKMSSLEIAGFNDEPMPLRGGGVIHLISESTNIGLLARVIAEHKETP